MLRYIIVTIALCFSIVLVSCFSKEDTTPSCPPSPSAEGASDEPTPHADIEPSAKDPDAMKEIEWWIDRFSKSVNKIDDADFDKGYSMAKLAFFEAKMGKQEESTKHFNAVLDLAAETKKSINPDGPTREAAVLQAKLGLFDRAIKFAQAAGGPINQDGTLHNILEEMARAGKYERAIETLKLFTDPTDVYIGQMIIIQAEIKSGKHKDAIAMLSGLEPPRAQDGRIRVADMLMKAGQKTKAEKIYTDLVASCSSPGEKSRIFCSLAEIQAETKQFKEALVTAEMIDEADSVPRSSAYAEIARQQAKAGLPESVETANKLKEDWYKCSVLAELVPLLYDAGEQKGAEQLLADILPLCMKGDNGEYAYKHIAVGQAKLGRHEEALASVQLMKMYKSVTLADIAMVEAKAGRYADATDTANKIGIDEKNPENGNLGDRISALLFIAVEEAKAGHKEDALKAFQSLKKLVNEQLSGKFNMNKDIYIIVIAVAESGCGMIDDALATIRSASPSPFSGCGWAGIAMTMARAGMTEQLKKEAESLTNADPLVSMMFYTAVLQELMEKQGIIIEEKKMVKPLPIFKTTFPLN